MSEEYEQSLHCSINKLQALSIKIMMPNPNDVLGDIKSWLHRILPIYLVIRLKFTQCTG